MLRAIQCQVALVGLSGLLGVAGCSQQAATDPTGSGAYPAAPAPGSYPVASGSTVPSGVSTMAGVAADPWTGVAGAPGLGASPMDGSTAAGADVASTADGTAPTSTARLDLPCDVAEVLQQHCWKCHGAKTDWGGPMSLTERSHFEQPGKLTTSQRVRDLVKARIHDVDRPMPPPTEAVMPEADKQILSQWLDGGAPAASEGGCQLDPSPASAAQPTSEGTAWEGVETSWPGGIKPEETCYQFLKHGQQGPSDETPHMTEMNETYVNFFYKVPWTEPVVATRWRTLYDNTQVLHHWLLYRSAAGGVELDGTWSNGLGTHPGSQLLAGWAVGGGDEDFPPGVGMRMPAPGSLFELEWHLYNTTGARVPDRSGIELCVVPESKVDPKFVAGLTWLGTEDLVIPPSQETVRGGICTPSFKNGGPVHIVKWLPHMHLSGKQMDTWVLRADGTEDHVFSEPFTFDQQISYAQNPPVQVNVGDRLFAQCTFQNTTSQTVLFGESTNEEMCYQFAVAYPAGSLDGGSLTWTGSDNTCISFNTIK